MRAWDTFRSVVRFRKFETDPVARRLRTAINVDDMRRVARRRLPRGVFDYIDGGADDERSVANNAAAFERIEFRPNVLRDVSEIDTATTLLGKPISMPLVLAPTGYTRLTHSQGELSVARAAERAGIPYSLSTMSTRSIEEVAAVSDGRKWFQVYTWKDRGLVRETGRAFGGGRIRGVVVDGRHGGARAGANATPGAGSRSLPEIGPGTIVDGIAAPGVDDRLPHPRTDDVRQRRPPARAHRW